MKVCYSLERTQCPPVVVSLAPKARIDIDATIAGLEERVDQLKKVLVLQELMHELEVRIRAGSHAVDAFPKLQESQLSVRITFIKVMVSTLFDQALNDLTGPSRRAVLVWPRSVAMYACRQLLGASYGEIGRAFDRDHGTVMYAVRGVADRMSVEPKAKAEVDHVLHLLATSLEKEAQ